MQKTSYSYGQKGFLITRYFFFLWILLSIIICIQFLIFILGKAELKPIIMKGKTDTIWITELEEIFGFPRHYTDVKNLSATNRQKILGKSWSVQTLTAILRPLCSYFKCNEDETNKETTS